MPANLAPCLHVNDLGRLGYAEALQIQRDINEQVSAGKAPASLLLVEHDPVVTVSRRRGAGDHLLATPADLSRLGIDVQETDRGGDITYHGPGQLVAYPILRLGDFGLNLGRYMRLLEDVVVQAVSKLGVRAHRLERCTGVWVSPESRPPAKLCALGVRIRRNTTMHGLALNVTTDLTHFDTIVPCGLRDKSVTSLLRLLGDACPPMRRVKDELAAAFETTLGAVRMPAA